ncbi:MAG: 3-isopropylmalate dehydratase [Thermoanaerobacteraceae bacterium]|uniref:aconitase family protein n=1 Tax=Thermanaeromonas sp. C210 TaxID=2731925 RepID=UPI00155CF5F4|nr:aconitase family protein [Thermanaeromonas sp. C210]MBE3581902.1 3-isopropylmalate dehydratase [Thermoanaerobacteraceae bacterium]GFN21850.1 3-isopropylmalate dehydratase large subunit [Thermanaeromonas sp. C210]
MHYAHRVLARAAGRQQAEIGEIIEVPVDLALGHDGSAGEFLAAWPPGARVAIPAKTVFTLDHLLPAPTVEARELHRRLLSFGREQQVHVFARGEGVLHQVVAERFTPRRGWIIAGADGHVATAGAFGALAFSLKPKDLVKVLLTGKVQVSVPGVYTVEIKGSLPPGRTARDLALEVIRHLNREAIRGKVLAFQGEGVWQLSVSGRMALCNLIGETGAVTGLIIPPEETAPGTKPDLELVAEEIEPLVACPPSPANVRPLRELYGLPITQAVVGGCSSGRLEDMRELACGLGENKVHKDVTLLVVPASACVLTQMEKEGLAGTLREQGALILPPGCGPCPGKHLGLLAPGDRVLAATVRNVPGRMGSIEGEIYLASPRAVGAAAAAGAVAPVPFGE